MHKALCPWAIREQKRKISTNKLFFCSQKWGLYTRGLYPRGKGLYTRHYRSRPGAIERFFDWTNKECQHLIPFDSAHQGEYTDINIVQQKLVTIWEKKIRKSKTDTISLNCSKFCQFFDFLLSSPENFCSFLLLLTFAVSVDLS